MPWKRLTLTVLTILAVQLGAVEASAMTDDEVDVSHGGWGLTGGSLAWAATTPLMSALIGDIMRPEDESICDLTPEQCQPGFGQYTLAGLTVLATLGITVGTGFFTAWLTRELEVSPKLGWGISGGIVGIPIFGMTWLGVPRFEPTWLDTTLGTTLMFGGAIATGFYFSEVSGRRGHAWPEFGFGVGGTLLGAGLGTLLCGSDSCAATPLLGALGGILGIGVSALVFGYDNSDTETTPQALVPQQHPYLGYSTDF